MVNLPRGHLSGHLHRRTQKLELPASGTSRTGPAAWRQDRHRILQPQQGAQQAPSRAREHGVLHDGEVKDPPHEQEHCAFRALSQEIGISWRGSSWSRPQLERTRLGHLHMGTMDSGYVKRGKVAGKGRNGKNDGRGWKEKRGGRGGSVIDMIGRRGVSVIGLRGKRDERDKRGRRDERDKRGRRGVRDRVDWEDGGMFDQERIFSH